MAKKNFKGNPVTTSGDLPSIGELAPDFKLVKSDLSNLTLSELRGKKIVLNIFLSLDTSTCAASVRRFNKIASENPGTVVLAISKDLPFAHNRFCTTEGITNVITLSGFRDAIFGKAYGIDILDGPLQGLYARSIVVINEKGKVMHSQMVEEMSEEPDYDSAMAALLT